MMSSNLSIKAKLSGIASESNIHGVSRLVSDRPIYLRLLWLVAFLGFLGFGMYQVITIFTKFFEYPTKTNIKINFDALTFPAITVCNMNIIKKSEAGNINSAKLAAILEGSYDLASDMWSGNYPSGSNDTGVTSDYDYGSGYDYYNYYNYYDNYDDPFFGSQSYYPVTVSSDYLVQKTFIEEYQMLSRQNRSVLGHQFDDMLIECTFAGTNCDPVSKTVVTFDYGNCYTLQSPRYIASSSGPTAGMTLTINLENHEAFEKMTESFGLRMVVHEVGSFPLPHESGMTISGGFETSIALKLTRIERQGSPYGDCQDPAEYLRNNFVRYSTESCLQKCLEVYIFDNCGCMAGYLTDEMVHFTTPTIEILPTANTTNATSTYADFGSTNTTSGPGGCFTADEEKCYSRLKRDFLKRSSTLCNCPPPCYENSYSTSYSAAIWPHNSKLEELKNDTCLRYNFTQANCPLNDLDEDGLGSNFLKVHIYYEGLNYQEVIEEPFYDASQIIADVGGSLGLCLGFSLLCLFEVLEACLESCRVCKEKLSTKRRSTSPAMKT